MDILMKRFDNLFKRLEAKTDPRALYTEILEEYSDPIRAFHSLSHIAECLQWLDKVIEEVYDPISLELAIWFHNVVWIPGEKANKDMSIDFATERLTELGIDPSVISSVQELINETNDYCFPHSLDGAILQDIDMVMLGASHQRYLRYQTQVKQEYLHFVDEAEYAQMRKRYLRHILGRPRGVYQTRFFQERLNIQASQNMSLELIESVLSPASRIDLLDD